MREAFPQAPDPFCQLVVQLAKLDEVLSPDAPDMTVACYKAQCAAHPAEGSGSQHCCQFAGSLNTVLQGHNNSLGAYQWTDSACGFRNLPSFHANKYGFHMTYVCRFISCLCANDGFA